MSWIVSMFLATVVCGLAFGVGRLTRHAAKPGTPAADRGMLVMSAAIGVFVLWTVVVAAYRLLHRSSVPAMPGATTPAAA